MEAGLVFDYNGRSIHWHVPANRGHGYLPDSHSLWQILWEHRGELGGVAHTHPWHGEVWFSATDVSTFAAIEEGLGRRLIWPIVTFTDIDYYEWIGPDKQAYGVVEGQSFALRPVDIQRLREISR